MSDGAQREMTRDEMVATIGRLAITNAKAEALIAELEAERDRECVWQRDWQITSHTAPPAPIWRTQCKHFSSHPRLRYCPYCRGKIGDVVTQ